MSKHSAVQRKEHLLELLEKNGSVVVSELSKNFHISEVTIRNDLAEMEQAGLLQRVHGGAVSTKRAYYELSLNDRMHVNKSEKIRIAKACADLIHDGDTLMIDSGTTTRYLAMELRGRSNLTVVTNALLVAHEFLFNRAVDVILLGGNLDTQYQFTYGNDAVAQLQKYRADKMILATDGIGAAYGLTTYHHQESDVSQLMAARSNEVIVVADHSKIGKEGFSNIMDISRIHMLVTDKTESEMAELEAIRQKSVAVIEA